MYVLKEDPIRRVSVDWLFPESVDRRTFMMIRLGCV